MKKDKEEWRLFGQLVLESRAGIPLYMIEKMDFIMFGICDEYGVDLCAFSGDGHNFNLLLKYPQALSLDTFVNALKAESSRKLKIEYPKNFGDTDQHGKYLSIWGKDFHFKSAGDYSLRTVLNHINSQREEIKNEVSKK